MKCINTKMRKPVHILRKAWYSLYILMDEAYA
jgi:hypothetical protein